MEEGFRDVLQANKREMFDGMRAYHDSEIKHANYAITILLSITGAVNAASVAILTRPVPIEKAPTVAVVLFAVVASFSFAIAATTHRKIRSDNDTYRRYGQEYYRTCKALGLMAPIGTEDDPTAVKLDRPIGQGKGYRRTQHIVWTFALLASAVTWAFSVILVWKPG